MGLGVSNTVKNKKPRTPKPEEVEERENEILELATAAQEVADSLRPQSEFKNNTRGRGDKAGKGDDAKAIVTGEEEEDDGMVVSKTAKTGNQVKATFGKDDITSRAVAAMQGADQIKEMERMAFKDMQRAQMLEKGLSKEQIAAYLGDDLSVVPKSKSEKIGDKALEAYQRAAVEEASAWRAEEALLQVAPSSSLLELDENGEPFEDRFVYVDEYTCIGCTHCSHVAPSTFFMENEYGRARVYQQGRDTEETVRDAILTCPVDCIHYVGWPELKRLETEREGIDINFKARLVGNDHDNQANGMQLISGNQGMRCDNCPSKGCYDCPMYSVGNDPEYKKRQEERKAKREVRLKKQREESSGKVRKADL
ncbi:unnamed protein product [Ascophyllum nodosum]